MRRVVRAGVLHERDVGPGAQEDTVVTLKVGWRAEKIQTGIPQPQDGRGARSQ